MKGVELKCESVTVYFTTIKYNLFGSTFFSMRFYRERTWKLKING